MASMDHEEEMNGCKDQFSHLTPGYRFYPTEEELLSFYLQNMLNNQRVNDIKRVIPVCNVYHFDPWQLPENSGDASNGDSDQWLFFSPRQEREVHGGRPTRTTPSGYWKATGSPAPVYSSANRAIGMKKTMVFYRGRAPNGAKTKWKMNEYRAFEVDTTTTTPKLSGKFSLCRVYIKSGCLRSFDRRPTTTTGGWRVLDAEPSDESLPMAKRHKTDHEGSSSSKNCDDSPSLGVDMDLEMLSDIDWGLLEWD